MNLTRPEKSASKGKHTGARVRVPPPAASHRMDDREAAVFLFGVNGRARTLRDWRQRGIGPAYLKLNGRVVYDKDDLQAFMQDSRVAAVIKISNMSQGLRKQDFSGGESTSA